MHHIAMLERQQIYCILTLDDALVVVAWHELNVYEALYALSLATVYAE